jgi:two-component system phosphate regulon sensor histidine kinase PhoR
MNRKIFISLVIMMSLSIIGITWVQIRWIKSAVETRNESFNYAVFTSLNNAAGEIESMRRMNSFNDFLFQDPIQFEDTASGITGYFSYDSYMSREGGNVSINIRNQISSVNDSGENTKVVIVQDTTFSDSVKLVISSPEIKSQVIQQGNNNISSASILMRQKDFLDWVRKRSSEFQNMSDRMLYEIYESEKAMDVDNNEIKSTLDRYFPFFNILTPYEFAVIKDGEITSVSSPKIDKKEFLSSLYKVRLFPDNIIKSDIILSVIFPQRRNYVLGSMTWILGGSLLFSLFIFSTFALSLYFILRQKKISEIKSDFINNMTHEFKTPIATISLAADTVTNPKVIKDENSVRHFIGMIKKENSRMDKQVETILQIASLDKKEIEFSFEETSLHSIIEKALDTIEIQIQRKHGTTRKVLAAADDRINGDTEHLTNLVHNLLDNAIKYSPEDPDITICTYNREHGIIMTVEDKGTGMSKSVQSKIFERFYRQSSGDVHDVKGFGLGLNYVKAIIDAHKGNITVTSEPGKGTKMEIFLPLNGETQL